MKLPHLRRLRNAIGVLIVALALASGGIVAAATSASAAACSGYSCHGLDPYKAGCSKWSVTSVGVYAYSDNTELAVLNNWYGHCSANWSEGHLTPAGLKAGDSIVITVHAIDSQGNWEFMCEPNIYGPGNTGSFEEPCVGQSDESCGPNVTQGYGGSGTPWTDMVDGTEAVATTSELCVYHDGIDVAYAAVNQ